MIVVEADSTLLCGVRPCLLPTDLTRLLVFRLFDYVFVILNGIWLSGRRRGIVICNLFLGLDERLRLLRSHILKRQICKLQTLGAIFGE